MRWAQFVPTHSVTVKLEFEEGPNLGNSKARVILPKVALASHLHFLFSFFVCPSEGAMWLVFLGKEGRG